MVIPVIYTNGLLVDEDFIIELKKRKLTGCLCSLVDDDSNE